MTRVISPLLTMMGTLVASVLIGQLASAQQEPRGKQPPMVELRSIIDEDTNGRVDHNRVKIQFDHQRRRITNQVVDGQNRMIGSERLRYDRRGRLIGREYLNADGSLKWRWTEFRYDKTGRPTKNDIVNQRGKRIGSYVWQYDDAGRLKRRDRLNADGSLRFYYGDIKFTAHGQFSEWTKYDASGRKIGLKKWQYSAP